MRPERNTSQCENPNVFTSIYENSISPRLPREGSLADRVMTHTTGARPFFETVSRELCENQRMSAESSDKALSFIARSAATGITVTGTAALVGLGLVVGSPLGRDSRGWLFCLHSQTALFMARHLSSVR